MSRAENRLIRSVTLLLALMAIMAAGRSAALELDDVRVTKQGRVYSAQVTFEIPASLEQVAGVLTDYEHPDRLSPDITRREVVSTTNGVTRVRTEMHSCVAFFCRNLTLTQDVKIVAEAIYADIVPEHSDFGSGSLLWEVTRNENGGSVVRHELSIEPDFFIPPLIGRLLIRRKLQQQIFITAQNLIIEVAREPASLTSH